MHLATLCVFRIAACSVRLVRSRNSPFTQKTVESFFVTPVYTKVFSVRVRRASTKGHENEKRADSDAVRVLGLEDVGCLCVLGK